MATFLTLLSKQATIITKNAERQTVSKHYLSTKRTKPITIKVVPTNIFIVIGSFRK